MKKNVIVFFSIFLVILPLIGHQSTSATALAAITTNSKSIKPVHRFTGMLDLFPEIIDFAQIFQQATVSSYYQTVYHLSEVIGSRPFGTEANIQARDWIRQKLVDYLDSNIVYSYGEYQNVIGIKNGKYMTDEVFCFTAHFDTVPDSPGADDDASGIALFLEIARLLGYHENLAMRMAFLGCNAEEKGLLGSYELAPYIKKLFNPKLVINADQLLAGVPLLYYTEEDLPYESYMYIAELIESFCVNYGQSFLNLYQVEPLPGWTRSDHYPFYLQGIPVLVLNEWGVTPYYHTALDKADQPEYIYDYGAELAGSIASSILFLSSRITDPYTVMNFQGTLEPGQSRSYFVQGLGGDYFASRLVSNETVASVQMKIENITDWGNNTGFQEINTGRNVLIVRNTGDSQVNYEIKNIYTSDDNRNGIADPYEQDPDGDGLSIYDEFQYGTDPFSADTDYDTLDDDFEIEMHYDPLSNDTDGDLMNDGYEYRNGLNPLFEGDADDDYDHDGLTNYEESLIGTFPFLSDTDNDGFTDLQEVQANTDPLNPEDFPSAVTTDTTSYQSSNTPSVNGSPAFEWYLLILAIIPLIWLRNRWFTKKKIKMISTEAY
ncbi:MAG: M28 family peptidase [Candidatus Odinarchaeota archaeon]